MLLWIAKVTVVPRSEPAKSVSCIGVVMVGVGGEVVRQKPWMSHSWWECEPVAVCVP